jgi:hypothetical protein
MSFTKKIQQDATVYKNVYFIFTLSSTCFGRHTAHHQETKIAKYAKPEAASAILGS